MSYNKKPTSDNEYFGIMVRAVFSVGFSRTVVADKWEGFREVFEHFDIDTIASWSQSDILDASERPEIVRNYKKIEATVHNAKRLQELIDEYGSIHAYIRSLDDLGFDKRIKQISKGFKWFGPTAAKIFLYLSGEPISSNDD